MPRLRRSRVVKQGSLTRAVQAVFRLALGRELNPYKVEAYAPRTVLVVVSVEHADDDRTLDAGADFRQLIRVRVAALNGCPF